MTLLNRISQRGIKYVFDDTFVTILHSTTVDLLVSLNFHIYFDSSVLFLYLGCLKSRMCKSRSY